jgi:hypothetical protein
MALEKLYSAKPGRIQKNDIRAREIAFEQMNELHIRLDKRQVFLGNPSRKKGAGKYPGAWPEFDNGSAVGSDPRRNDLSQRLAGRSDGTNGYRVVEQSARKDNLICNAPGRI